MNVNNTSASPVNTKSTPNFSADDTGALAAVAYDVGAWVIDGVGVTAANLVLVAFLIFAVQYAVFCAAALNIVPVAFAQRAAREFH